MDLPNMDRRWPNLRILLVVVLPLLSYPLSWLPLSFVPFRFNVVLPIAAAFLVAALFFLTRTCLEGCVTLPPTNVLLPLGGVFVSSLLSTRFSQNPGISVTALPVLAGNLAIFIAAASAAEDRLARLFWYWLGAGVLVALNGLVRIGHGEFLSTIGNRNFLAVYLAVSVCIGVSLWDRRAAIASVVLIIAMCFCDSRGAWIALGITTTLWLLVGMNANRFWRILVATLVIVAGGIFVWPYLIEQWRVDVRPPIWKGTLGMIAARPSLGHGLKTFEIEYAKFRLPEYFLRLKATNLTDHAHNELLEIAAEQGIFGLATTLWLWVTAAWADATTWRNSNASLRRLRLGLLAATAVFILHGMVDVDLRYPPNQPLLWILLGVLVSGNRRSPTVLRLNSNPSGGIWATACICVAAVVAVEAVAWPVWPDIWERKARIAEARNDLVAAGQAAGRSLEIQPLRLGTRYFLAGVLARIPTEEARAQAIEECLRLEALAPDYGDITFNLGQLYLVEGRPGDALPYLRRAVEINPYNTQRRAVLARALAEVGQSDE